MVYVGVFFFKIKLVGVISAVLVGRPDTSVHSLAFSNSGNIVNGHKVGSDLCLDAGSRFSRYRKMIDDR